MNKLIFTVCALALLPFSIQAYEVSKLSVDPLGSGTSLRVGSTSEVARFRLTNDGRKNLSVERLRLKNYGSARLNESFESLEIYYNNLLVGRSSMLLSKSANFTFDQLLLPPGDSLILSVKGQLVYGRLNKDIQLGIHRKEDVLAKEITTGFYANCEDCRNTRFETYELRSGQVGISRQSYYRPSRYYGSRSSTRSRTYTRSNYSYTPIYSRNIPRTYNSGTRGVTFLSSSVNSNTGIQVDGIFFPIGSGSEVSDKDGNGQANQLSDYEDTFGNFRLYVNGYEAGSASGFETRDGTLGILFNNTIDLPANNQVLVTGKIDNDAVNGDKLRLVLNRSSLLDPKYLNSGSSVGNTNINGQIQSQRTETQYRNRLNIYQVD